MLLHTNKSNISTNGVLSESKFTIQASAKAFKILSSSLYSNKIKAIIRELSCNAYDAHIANNNVHEPFDIQLPTELELNFKIRDYGTGLSHENIMELYVTYFNSTKTESNDYIGALGLGSKSPFSYTNTFSVSSYFNGKHRSYSAYLDDNGMPNIVMLMEINSIEPNGLEIEFPVNSNDIYQFKQTAQDVFQYFDIKPNVINHKLTYTDDTVFLKLEDNWICYNRSQYLNVVQGNICYPILKESISNFPLKYEYLMKLPIVIKFPLGSLDVAASREELSYDKITCDNLINQFDKIHNSIIKHYQDMIDQTDTTWNVQAKFNNLINTHYISSSILTHNNIYHNSKKLQRDNIIDITDSMPNDIPMYYIDNTWSSKTRKIQKRNIIQVNAKSKIIFNDLKSKFKARINNYIDDPKIKYIYEFKVGKDYNQSDIDTIISALGNPEYMMVSDLSLPTKIIDDEKLYNVPKFSNWDYIFDDYYYTKDEINKFDKCYYVELIGKTAISITYNQLNIIIKNSKILGIIDKDTRVIGLQKGVMNIIDTSKHINFLSHVTQQIQKHSKFQEFKLNNIPELDTDVYFYQRYKNILKVTTVQDPDYIKMLKQYEYQYIRSIDEEMTAIQHICNKLDINTISKNTEPNYQKIIYDRYPLLNKLVGYYHDDSRYFEEFENYINLKYESLK